MPCLDESELPTEKDVALEILGIVTPRHNIAGLEPHVVREVTLTDHLNKRLLTTFLERMNMVIEPATSSNVADDNATDEFED